MCARRRGSESRGRNSERKNNRTRKIKAIVSLSQLDHHVADFPSSRDGNPFVAGDVMRQGGSSLSTGGRQSCAADTPTDRRWHCAVEPDDGRYRYDLMIDCSLLGRLIFDYYERRCRRDISTTCHLTFDRCCGGGGGCCRPAVGGRRFTDGRGYSGCTCCHGNDRRERRPALVRQLSRRRARLLERVHNTDLPNTPTNIIIIIIIIWGLITKTSYDFL